MIIGTLVCTTSDPFEAVDIQLALKGSVFALFEELWQYYFLKLVFCSTLNALPCDCQHTN
jgi:hypothetical protein